MESCLLFPRIDHSIYSCSEFYPQWVPGVYECGVFVQQTVGGSLPLRLGGVRGAHVSGFVCPAAEGGVAEDEGGGDCQSIFSGQARGGR